MKEIVLPSDPPMTLVTTTVRADLPYSDRFLLDLHSPSHDVRLHFADEFILLACRRALTAMLNDARRLHTEAIAGRLYRLNSNAYHRWNLSGHL